MINFNKVSFGYGDKNVIDDFNFSFPDNGLVSLIGPSGCGKTTLLNLIAGIIEPKSGTITYSKNINNINDSISIIFQENNLFDNLTTLDNIKLLTEFKKDTIDIKKIDEMLDKLGVLKYKDTKVSDLSGGERQRVSIAIALLLDKKIILADEPLSNLDIDNSKNVLTLLKQLSEERLIIFSSHNIDILSQYCDKIINMEDKEYSDNKIYDLYSPIKKGKNLFFSKLIFTYFKVLGKKHFMKIISVVMLVILISVLSLTFTLSTVSYKSIISNTIKSTKVEDVTMAINPYPYYKNQSEIDAKYQEIKKKLNFMNVLYEVGKKDYNLIEDTKYGNEIFYYIVDNKLNDNEIIITDYLFYELQESATIDKNINIKNSKGLEFEINKYGLNHEKIKLRIKDIIYTSEYKYREEGMARPLSGSHNDYYHNRIFLNKLTWSTILYYDPTATEIFKIDFNQDSKYLSDELIECIYESDLMTSSSVGVTSALLQKLEEYSGVTYNIGDIIEFDYYDQYQNVIFDEPIHFRGSLEMIEESEDIYFMLSPLVAIQDIVSSEIKNPDIYFISTDVKKIMDIYNEYNHLMPKDANTGYGQMYYDGYIGDNDVFLQCDNLILISKYILIILVVIISLFSMYYVVSTYALNKNRFMILKIYGMKKSNEFYLMELDLIFTVFLSTVFGIILNFLLSIWLKGFIESNAGSKMHQSLFNLGHISLCSLMILVFISIIYFIIHLILTRKKLKTHIGN